jgi:endoglucanase
MSAELTADPIRLAREAHARLARTVNIGPDLGAPQERGWTITVERPHLEDCAQHGFTAVRLLMHLAAHRTTGGLDPRMLRRVEQIADHAASLGLAVVIANHRDRELIADPERHLAATLAAVAQLAGAFAGRGTDLIVEPLAEPGQALDPVWNTVTPELIGAVRGQDQHRTILLGPRTMNNARFLGELTLPEQERNLIVGIHHYWPVTFTMQGEMWLGEDHIFGSPRDWLGTTWDQTPAQEAELRAGFAQVAGWGTMTGRCSSPNSAPPPTPTCPAGSAGPGSTARSPNSTASRGESGHSHLPSRSTTRPPAPSTHSCSPRSWTDTRQPEHARRQAQPHTPVTLAPDALAARRDPPRLANPARHPARAASRAQVQIPASAGITVR